MITDRKSGHASAFSGNRAARSERLTDCGKCTRSVLPCIDCPDGSPVSDHPGARIAGLEEPTYQMGHGFVCKCRAPRYLVMTDRGLVCRPYGTIRDMIENTPEDYTDDDLPF